MDTETFSKYLKALAATVGGGEFADLLTEQARKDAAIRRFLLVDPVREPHADLTPAALLRSEYRIVDFRYRDDEFESFTAWCAAEQPCRWRLIHGDSGRGKTRLMVELIGYLNGHKSGNHWIAGFISVDRFQSDSALDLDAFDLLFDTPKPLLIVLDYAERQSAIVTELLKRSRQRAEARPGTTTRIALVARRKSDIWDRIFTADNDLHSLKRGLLEDLRLSSVTEGFNIEAVFAEAFEDFTRHFRAAHPAPRIDFSRMMRANKHPDIGLVHMLALLAVIAPSEIIGRMNSRPTEDEVLTFLLEREKRHWLKTAKGLHLPPELQQESVLTEAAGLLTLASQQGAISSASEARNVLRSGTLLAGQTEAMLDRLVAAFRETYPGIGYVNGVAPDLLGDFLIAGLQD